MIDCDERTKLLGSFEKSCDPVPKPLLTQISRDQNLNSAAAYSRVAEDKTKYV